jgi:histidinol-phosphate aminotransferase
MSVSRRRFLSGALAAGAVSTTTTLWVSARGREGALATGLEDAGPASLLHLDSNENPTGPCPAAAAAIASLVAEGARYPYKAAGGLVDAIARRHRTTADHVVIGCGSTEILVNAVRAYTSRTAGIVAPTPTFESPLRVAQSMGHPVHEVPVTASLDVDLEGLGRHVSGAGLVFLCNPNNPTGRAWPLDVITAFVKDVRRRSPDTVVLLDEAYVEYAHGSDMGSGEALALSMPGVVVSRTFSKAYGLAGLRVGYAIGMPATLRGLRAFALPMGVSTLGIHAATAALSDPDFEARERQRNAAAAAWLRGRFEEAGYPVGPSHTNFLMVDIRRDCDEFRRQCFTKQVAVGRKFPPLDTYSRISIGTIEEMRRAWTVFEPLLRS